jgi:hypothetical protein
VLPPNPKGSIAAERAAVIGLSEPATLKPPVPPLRRSTINQVTASAFHFHLFVYAAIMVLGHSHFVLFVLFGVSSICNQRHYQTRRESITRCHEMFSSGFGGGG